MRRLFALFLVLVPIIANAGTLTITTTAEQDFVLAARLATVNQQITEQNAANAKWNAANPTQPQKGISPLLTANDYATQQITGVLNGMVPSYRTDVLGVARTLFEAAPPDKKLAACTALGLTGKLPECP